MARLVVLYKTPTDGAAFDRYYFETHVPIAKIEPALMSPEERDGAATALRRALRLLENPIEE